MRILIATDAWHPQVNGVVTTLTHVIKELKAMGHEVHVIEPGQFWTLPVPTYPQIRFAVLPFYRVRKAIKSFKPDAIHIATEGPIGYATRYFCMHGRARGIPFTTAYHSRFPEYIESRMGIPRSWTYRFMRGFHGSALRTMVTTPLLKAELEGHGFRNLTLWSRGIDAVLFRPYEEPFLDAPRPIYLYVGRLANEKNLDAFLSARVEGTKYVVGDGPERASLESRYPHAVFVGEKFGEKLARYYAAADVFVFPSKTDTFGLVILEANACGTPVAAYDVQGPVEIIKDGFNGYTGPDLEKAMRACLTIDRKLPRAYAERYSWRKSAEQFAANLTGCGEVPEDA